LYIFTLEDEDTALCRKVAKQLNQWLGVTSKMHGNLRLYRWENLKPPDHGFICPGLRNKKNLANPSSLHCVLAAYLDTRTS